MIINIISKVVFTVSVICLFLPSGPVSAADVKVVIKVPVQIDHLHPDVISIQLWDCNYLDTSGRDWWDVHKGKARYCGDAYIDKAIANVGGNRSVNKTLESCVLFDEQAAKDFKWDRYRCAIKLVLENDSHYMKIDDPKYFWSVRPGAELVSEGKFDMYAK